MNEWMNEWYAEEAAAVPQLAGSRARCSCSRRSAPASGFATWSERSRWLESSLCLCRRSPPWRPPGSRLTWPAHRSSTSASCNSPSVALTLPLCAALALLAQRRNRRHPLCIDRYRTVALDDGGRYVVGNVGDSRAYLLRGGALGRLTSDDTYVQRLVDCGLLAPEEASRHPQRSVVTTVLHGGAKTSDRVVVWMV